MDQRETSVSNLDQRTFSLGVKPEIVITDRSGIAVVSGGNAFRIALRADEDSTKIVHETEKGDVVLSQGGAVEMARLYEQLATSLSGRKQGVINRKGLVAAAFVLGTVLGLSLNQPPLPVNGQAPAEASVQNALPGGPQEDFAKGFHDLMQRRAAEAGQPVAPAPNAPSPPSQPDQKQDTPAPSGAAGVPGALAPFQKGTAILPAPDFLKVPDVLPPIPAVEAPKPLSEAPATAPAAAPATQATAPTAQAPAGDIASSVAMKLAQERIAAATAALDSTVQEAAKAPVAPAAPAAPAPAPEPAKPQAEAAKEQQPAAPAASVAPTKETTAPAPTAPAAPSAEAPAAPQPQKSAGAQLDDVPINNVAIRDAMHNLVRKGMTANDGMQILAHLEKLTSESGEISAEMLNALPHEVARVLKEAGIVPTPTTQDPDAPGGVPYRIIRLPEKVLEKHRGKDGIPSVPEADTWVATGNSVSLPLPGGGDIKTVDDIKSFGLNP